MASCQQFQRQQYAPQPQPSIWSEMAYTPPSGPCNQKLGIMASCTCYRFMVHPLKAATSFDCDGCGHHASFHKFASLEEEEVLRARREGNGSHGGVGRLEMETGVRLRLEERGGGKVMERIEDIGETGDDEAEVEEEEELVEVELPVRGKRRMITAAANPGPGVVVTKTKGKVVVDLEGEGGEKKKGTAGRKRKG